MDSYQKWANKIISVISQSENILMQLSEEQLETWIDLVYETSETKAGILGADHVVYIGRVKKNFYS